MKIKSIPQFKRPREKLAELGEKGLKDYELLAVLLRTGYQGKSALDIAKRILFKFNLQSLSQLSFADLAKLKGVGKSRAAAIIAAFGLSRRIDSSQKAIRINSPEDIVKVLGFIRNRKREHFVALYLDAENKLITQKIISVGTINASLVHPREVFYPAIHHRAVAVIVAHNHPSGNAAPSHHDIEVTKKLLQAGEILNIDLLDHIIITRNNYTSLKEKGLIGNMP